MTSVFLFGYSQGRGFCLMHPGLRRAHHPLLDPFTVPLDGGYAPRRARAGTRTAGALGPIVWRAQGVDVEARRRIEYDSDECPQGEYLHHLDVYGFTALAWWDRTQGDRRGNCSTTLLAEGDHDISAMLDQLAADFPGVLDNLRRAGVELREVRR